MTEYEQVRDEFVNDLQALKRALYPAASPDIDQLIAAVTDNPSVGLRTAEGEHLSGETWINLPEERKLEEMKSLQVKVREKLERIHSARAKSAESQRMVMWALIAGLAIVAIGALVWFVA